MHKHEYSYCLYKRIEIEITPSDLHSNGISWVFAAQLSHSF